MTMHMPSHVKFSVVLGLFLAVSSAPAAPATRPATRTISDVKTLEELQSLETIHVDKRWAVRLGLADGGAEAGPWKLLYCLADFPPEKNAEPALSPPALELSGAMGSLGPVMFTVDDPAVLQKSSQPAAGDLTTERGLVYCAAIPTAWKGAYRIRVWTWDKRLLAERVISVDQPVPNYWQDLVGSELHPPTLRPGPYALVGPAAAYPSYGPEFIWSQPKGEAQPLGQATALPGQIPARNGMYLEHFLGLDPTTEADRSNPIRLSVVAGQLQIDAPIEMETPSGHHLLARWWVNGEPILPVAPENVTYGASGDPRPAKSFSFPLTLPAHLGARPGDKIALQVLSCPLGFEFLWPERFRTSERPSPVIRARWRLPLLSEPIEFVATRKMLPKSTMPGTWIVAQLLDEQGQPLTNQSLSMMPVTVGYPPTDIGGPYFADKKGKVAIGPVPPGERQYVLRQACQIPTIVSLNAPLAGESQAKVTVKRGELPGGKPDLDINVKTHEENGMRSMDLAITSNTDKPYTLSPTDLQLVSGEYRIFPPQQTVAKGAEVPPKGKGSHQLTVNWNSYLRDGIWVSRRGEEIDEKGPTSPAGAGLAYYRIGVGNCYSLPIELPKLDEVRGRVIDHAGRRLAGATVYLVTRPSLQLVNSQPGGGHWSNGRLQPFGGFDGAKAFTDKDGAFTLTAVGGDNLVVVAGDMVWLARLPVGKEQTIQLPQPGKVTISYDIAGGAKDGVIRLQLMTWDLPDWAGVATAERYVVCKNGGTLELDGLTPGEYDAFRYVECGRIGMRGFTSFLDRCKLKIEAGKTARLDYVRAKGGPISGQIVGLKEAGYDGALVKVQSEQATGKMTADDTWKILTFDAVTTDATGQFQTSRIAPGTYMVMAEAFKPESPSERRLSGIRMPTLLGKVKVVVPENGQVEPVRIEVPPPSDAKPSAPAQRGDRQNRL